MSVTQAWTAIFNLSAGNQWVAIPESLRKITGLRSDIGISGGTLMTRVAAAGANEFLARLNKIGEK